MPRALLVLALASGACGEPPPGAGTANVVETREVVLEPGTRLAVPVRPVRVLPANAAAMDLVAELLSPERLVALPAPALHWSIIAEEPARWAGLPLLERFTGEAVLALDPDLIIASTWSDRAPITAAQDAGIPVVVLPDAESWEGLIDAARLLGDVLNEQQRAAEFTRELEARRAALTGAGRPRLRILPYANFGAGGTTSGAQTTLDLAISLCGFENAAASAGLARHADLSLEQVLTIDPDLFLTASSRDGVTAGASFLRGEEVLESLRAIREDRIVVLPPELFSASSHRVLDAAEALARAVDGMD